MATKQKATSAQRRAYRNTTSPSRRKAYRKRFANKREYEMFVAERGSQVRRERIKRDLNPNTGAANWSKSSKNPANKKAKTPSKPKSARTTKPTPRGRQAPPPAGAKRTTTNYKRTTKARQPGGGKAMRDKRWEAYKAKRVERYRKNNPEGGPNVDKAGYGRWSGVNKETGRVSGARVRKNVRKRLAVKYPGIKGKRLNTMAKKQSTAAIARKRKKYTK